MKSFIIALLLLPSLLFSQSDWDGNWKTTFKKMSIYITISDDGNNVALTIPAQGLSNMQASNSEVDDARIDFSFSTVRAAFYGNLANGILTGKWLQGGNEYDMVFTRTLDDLSFPRPQTPVEPFPYKSEDITIDKTDKTSRIAGTLTFPEGSGPFPAIVLIAGSGPQNRDSEIFKHKPFLVLSDYFTRNGYAVLRFDERGIGKSAGKFKGATSQDFANDVNAVFEYLESRPEVDKNKVGLMGHSEGGMIAPLVAVENPNVDFIVLVAGPGIPPKEIMKYQMSHQYDKLNLTKDGKKKKDAFFVEMFDILATDGPNDEVISTFQGLSSTFYYSLSKEDQEKFGPTEQAFYFSMAGAFFDPWMRYFLQYDPAATLKKVDCPVLAVNGKKDTQVQAKANIKGIKKALKAGGNKKVKTKYFRKLNHLFQTSKSGEGSEYMTNSETFNEGAMAYMLKWMNAL